MVHAEQIELLHANLHAAVQVQLDRGHPMSAATEIVLLRTFAKAFREAFPDRRDDVSTTDLLNLTLSEVEAAAKQLENGMQTRKYEALLSNREHADESQELRVYLHSTIGLVLKAPSAFITSSFSFCSLTPVPRDRRATIHFILRVPGYGKLSTLRQRSSRL
jgi:hypothetical protein